MLNVRPPMVRTRTPVSVVVEPALQPCAVISTAMPGRIIEAVRVDGGRAPLLNADLLDLSQTFFVEGKVMHFCSYRSGEPVRFDAVLRPKA